jgi:hypothetical protein
VLENGHKYNLTDLAASLGLHQLRKVDAFHARRRALAARYTRGLAQIPGVLPPPDRGDVEHACHLYLPRLAGPEVLVQAIRDGVALLTWRSDTFAYAESHDDAAARYAGLRGGHVVSLSSDSTGVLVKPDVARRQMDAEVPPPSPGPGPSPRPAPGPGPGPSPAPPERTLRRFHGTVSLDPARVGRDASRIADEVIAHLAGQVDAEVTVTLEIEADLPNGASDQIVRTVTENSRTLRFTSQGFESE